MRVAAHQSARALTSVRAVRCHARRGPSSCTTQGGLFYGLERYPWESSPMYMLVGAAKLLAIACSVQSGFRVSDDDELAAVPNRQRVSNVVTSFFNVTSREPPFTFFLGVFGGMVGLNQLATKPSDARLFSFLPPEYFVFTCPVFLPELQTTNCVPKAPFHDPAFRAQYLPTCPTPLSPDIFT